MQYEPDCIQNSTDFVRKMDFERVEGPSRCVRTGMKRTTLRRCGLPVRTALDG